MESAPAVETGKWGLGDHRKFLIIVTLVALVLRLAAMAYVDLRQGMIEQNFDVASAKEPYAMARSLLDEGVLSLGPMDGVYIPTANQPPLYPLFLAGVLKVFPDDKSAFVFVQSFNVLIGCLVPWLTFLLARRFFSDVVAKVAAVLTAVSPLVVYMPVEPHSITLGLVLSLTAALLFTDIYYSSFPSLKKFVWAGVVCGVLVLIRSELALLCPIVFFLILKAHGRSQLAGLAAFTVAATVFIAPWIARNAIVLGKPTLSTTMFLNLTRGNHANATGGSYQWSGKISWPGPSREKHPELNVPSDDWELKSEAAFREKLFEEVSADPGHVMSILPNKLLFFWAGDLTHPKGKQLPSVLVHAVTSLFALMGLVFVLRKRVKCWPVWMWVAVYQAIVLAFFALPRYRLNVEPFLLILAAVGCVWLWGMVRRGSSVRVLGGVES